jgi:plasmid maintenance system killer protein
LEGKLAELYSVLINVSYRICIDFILEEDRIIPIDIGKHDEVY